MTVIGTCAICGDRQPIRAAVVRWTLFQEYQAVDRCVDVKACRERVEGRGDEWPIAEPSERRTVA